MIVFRHCLTLEKHQKLSVKSEIKCEFAAFYCNTDLPLTPTFQCISCLKSHTIFKDVNSFLWYHSPALCTSYIYHSHFYNFWITSVWYKNNSLLANTSVPLITIKTAKK